MISLHRPLLAVGLLALLVHSAAAADIDKYLPDDTNGLIVLNVRQVVEAPLFKKSYVPLAQKALKAKPDLQKLLKDMNFDPFRDLERVLLAGADSCERNADNKEPGFFLIVHGKFDLPRIHAKLAEIAPYVGKVLQVQRVGTNLVYELSPEGTSFFLAWPDRSTLVVAARREVVAEAFERGSGKKKLQLKYPDVRDLLARTDGKQPLWLVATERTTLSFDTVFNRTQKVDERKRKTLADSGVYEVSGGFTLGEGVKGAFGVKVKDALTAKAVGDALQQELAKAIDKDFDGTFDDRRLAPVREFLKEMVIVGDGKHIVIQSEAPGRVFHDAVK